MKYTKPPAPWSKGSKGDKVLYDGYLYTCINNNEWKRKWVRSTPEPAPLKPLSVENMIKHFSIDAQILE
jgi:hypothetical protein